MDMTVATRQMRGSLQCSSTAASLAAPSAVYRFLTSDFCLPAACCCLFAQDMDSGRSLSRVQLRADYTFTGCAESKTAKRPIRKNP